MFASEADKDQLLQHPVTGTVLSGDEESARAVTE